MAIVSNDLLTAMNGTSSSSSTNSSSSLNDNSPDAIQNRFLKLLIAQMKNQDPSNPMDNSQMTTQMAQLSTVSGISQLNSSLSTLMSGLNSSQALSTASMIGHSVLAPGNNIQLVTDTTKDASGKDVTTQKAVFGVNLSGTASSVVVTVKDSTGAVVRTMELGNQSAGAVPVIWDGTNDQGSASKDGNYTFTVNASNNGTPVSVSALSFGTVASVSTASDGVKLNVTNVGTIKPTDIVQIL